MITEEMRWKAALGIMARDQQDPLTQRAVALLGALDDLPPHQRAAVLTFTIALSSIQTYDPPGFIEEVCSLLRSAPLGAMPTDDEVRRFFAGQS